MNIAICEDDFKDLENIKNTIQEYADKHNENFNIFLFSSGEKLLSEFPHSDYDLIFLDIYMNGISGIETAQRLTKLRHCNIVFITNIKDYALDAISLDAIHYLIKPICLDDIAEVLNRYKNRIHENDYLPIEVKTKQGTLYLNPAHISYFESFNKTVTIHYDEKTCTAYTPLFIFESLLDENLFFRPQRSFLVNMEYIEEIEKNEIILTDGTKIRLSRLNQVDLKKKYEQFIFRQIREGKR